MVQVVGLVCETGSKMKKQILNQIVIPALGGLVSLIIAITIGWPIVRYLILDVWK
jgi:hypothetical protein